MNQKLLLRELPEEERPREKMLRKGASFLSNRELLAILIRTGTKELPVTDLADRVLALRPEGLAALADCTPEELSQLPGMGIAKACQITAALELGRRIATAPREKRVQIHDPAVVANLFMEEMRHRKQEVFRVLLLNTRHEILTIQEVSVGDLSSSIAHPREVFRDAVRRSAACIVAAHNHPSGSPEPSRNDLRITRRLAETGAILGIPLLDHIIIGDGEYISLREQGYLQTE